jgi:hypothetical protein
MSTLTRTRSLVNLPLILASTANPRDSWPDWTDESRWEPTPDDEPRPTFGPDFHPSPEDLAEAVALLNADATDLDAEALADHWWLAERMADAFADPTDRLHPAELVEAGYRPGAPSSVLRELSPERPGRGSTPCPVSENEFLRIFRRNIWPPFPSRMT